MKNIPLVTAGTDEHVSASVVSPRPPRRPISGQGQLKLSVLAELESPGRVSSLMPSSRLADTPNTHPSFLKHRLDRERPVSGLKIDLPGIVSVPTWASLPTPPMSGTPPPQRPTFDPPSVAGQRRKREETPPTTTEAGLPSSVATVASADILSPPGAGTTWQPWTTQSEQSYVQVPPTLSYMQPQQTIEYGNVTTIPVTQESAVLRRLQISPKATRKNKAHVASACVNCKRKHLRCDEQRPCKRCQQVGKEDTCVDVEHKKRGRPPLKPEDPSNSRLLSTSLSLPPIGPSNTRYHPALPPLLPNPRPSASAPYGLPTIAYDSSTARGSFVQPPQRPHSMLPPHQPPLPVAPQYQVQYSGYGMPQQPFSYDGRNYPGTLFPRAPPMQPTGTNTNASEQQGADLQLPPIRPSPTTVPQDLALPQNFPPHLAQQPYQQRPPIPQYQQQPLPQQYQQPSQSQQYLQQPPTEPYQQPIQQVSIQPPQQYRQQTQLQSAQSYGPASSGITYNFEQIQQPQGLAIGEERDTKRPRWDTRGILDDQQK